MYACLKNQATIVVFVKLSPCNKMGEIVSSVIYVHIQKVVEQGEVHTTCCMKLHMKHHRNITLKSVNTVEKFFLIFSEYFTTTTLADQFPKIFVASRKDIRLRKYLNMALNSEYYQYNDIQVSIFGRLLDNKISNVTIYVSIMYTRL